MTVDPQAQALLDNLTAQGVPDFPDLGVEASRGFINAFLDLEGPAQEVAEAWECSAPGPDGNEIPMRVYRPSNGESLPILMYFHGGYFVIGGLEVADKPCRQLANVTGCVVVSVDYRLAPEHKAPAGAEDCYAATRWVATNAERVGGDPSRLGVTGDSAGGGLAATVSLMARDRGGPTIGVQILQYPVTDMSKDDYPSRISNGEGFLLTRRAMEWFMDLVIDKPDDVDNPYISPVRALDLAGLPPAMVITAGNDPLHDEGEAYARRMEAAGVSVVSLENPTMIHGFLWMAGIVEHANRVYEQIGQYVRDNLVGETA
jgi:acetyl esterase